MWEQYRKTFVLNQIFILAACAGAYFYIAPGSVITALAILVMMELGSLAGAWWGARLKRKIEDNAKKLPLQRR